MKILVDTHVFLDVLLERESYLQDSLTVLDWCDSGPGLGWLAWHTLSNLSFIGGKLVGKKKTLLGLEQILEVFEVAPVDSECARRARSYGFSDFEGAMQAASAVSAGAKWIVTRNVRDFRKSPVPALSPKKFLDEVCGG